MPLRPGKILQPRVLAPGLLAVLVLGLSAPSAAGLAAGLSALAAGAGLRGWGAGHLVKTDRLTVSGPYAHLRHPLYLGTLLIAAGFVALAGGWLALLGVPGLLGWFLLVYFPRKERIESARLERLYGEPYRRYRAEVPALRPRLRPWRPAADVAAKLDRQASWTRERFVANNEQATLLGVVVGAVLLGLRWVVAA